VDYRHASNIRMIAMTDGTKRSTGAFETDGYDLFGHDFVVDPQAHWTRVRASGCPIAHSDKWGGSWMLVGFDDIRNLSNDQARFSSRAIEVSGPVPPIGGGLSMPPLTTGPPDHKAHRDLLMPFFMPERIAAMEPFIRGEARRLAEGLAAKGGGDAVGDYARPIALAVLTHMLDVPSEMQAKFSGWVERMMRLGPQDQAIRKAVIEEKLAYLGTLLDERSTNPGGDVISTLATATIDGQPLSRKHKLGSLFLLALAGADTTWSAIGASLWHLGSHHADRAKLLAEPTMLRRTAMEELLRFYAPVTISRIATGDVELHGRCIAAQERVILPLPAANRDPRMFENPDAVDIERKQNRHVTFSSGIHRCLGATLARLELRVALEEWLRAMPNYEVIDPEAVAWTPGQTRGPEAVPFRVTPDIVDPEPRP
jgi:cytochrome P450